MTLLASKFIDTAATLNSFAVAPNEPPRDDTVAHRGALRQRLTCTSWHRVLNGSPLGLSEAESDLMDRRLCAIAERSNGTPRENSLLLPKDFSDPDVFTELSRSWLRIFEVGPILPGIPVKMAYTDQYDRDWISDDNIAAQACLWLIEPGHFVSWRPVAPAHPRKFA